MNSTTKLSADEVGILLSSATQAPSMHNTQPWRFEVEGSVVDVLLDEERELPAEDASGRLVRIGLGAAAFNIRVAAGMLGHEATFALRPDPARPELVARIFLADRQVPIPEFSRLYGELRRRHTYRGPMLAHEVSPRVLDLLDGAVHAERAGLHRLESGQLSALGDILRAADDLDLHAEDRLHERLHWIGGDRTGDGIPENSLGPLPARSGVVRDLSAGFDDPHRSQAVFEQRPLVVVLSTADEDERAWLRAGQALQRMLLVATSYDLAASFLNQPLEYADLRPKIRDLIGGRAWPQMIIRLGYPAHDSGRTPRREWHDSLDRWF